MLTGQKCMSIYNPTTTTPTTKATITAPNPTTFLPAAPVNCAAAGVVPLGDHPLATPEAVGIPLAAVPTGPVDHEAMVPLPLAEDVEATGPAAPDDDEPAMGPAAPFEAAGTAPAGWPETVALSVGAALPGIVVVAHELAPPTGALGLPFGFAADELETGEFGAP